MERKNGRLPNPFFTPARTARVSARSLGFLFGPLWVHTAPVSTYETSIGDRKTDHTRTDTTTRGLDLQASDFLSVATINSRSRPEIDREIAKRDKEAFTSTTDTLVFSDAEKRRLMRSLLLFRVSMLTVDRDLGSFFEKGEEECCVCKQRYQVGQEICLTECFHQFHAACLAKWLEQDDAENSCPICREPIVSNASERDKEH